VIIPKENRKDLKEIPENILSGFKIHAVSHMDEVLKHALTHVPVGMSMPTDFIRDSIVDIYLDNSSVSAH